MEITMVECDGTMRLPENVRKAARLKNGTLLEATITSEGILLRTMRPSDTEQTWAEAGKRLAKLKAKAAKDQAKSGGTVYYSEEEFFAALEQAAAEHADV